MTPLFLFGTLRDPRLLKVVAGSPLVSQPAALRGHTVVWASGERFPLLVEQAEGVAQGEIVFPTSEALARLDFYELGFGYERRTVTVESDEHVQAHVYFPTEDWKPGPAFDIEDWSATYGDLAIEAATELMGQFRRMAQSDVARSYPQMVSRADSRLRARREPSPAAFGLPDRTIAIDRTEWPYSDYFSVREDWLRFPTFNGGHSDTVKRATFLGGDAITVLPYDPKRDTVLLVRQFRHGPFCRGDTNPWTLEPIAGRIDAGETPEETALREMREEANIDAVSLHQIGRYYPTPGAYSEWLVSYVALADLSDADGTVTGMEDEAEDIMSHVVSLDEVLAMIADGRANTGPLILTALWLQANKKRFASGD